MGHSKSCDHNVIIYPGIDQVSTLLLNYEPRRILICHDHPPDGTLLATFPVILWQRAAGTMPCQVASGTFGNSYHDNNHCFTSDGIFYSDGKMRSCTKGGISGDVYQTFDNKLYSGGNVPPGNFSAFNAAPCTDFSEWQAAGQDTGSQMLPLPSAEEIVAIGKQVLME